MPGWIGFTNKTMVDTAHDLGLTVKPWTPKWVTRKTMPPRTLK